MMDIQDNEGQEINIVIDEDESENSDHNVLNHIVRIVVRDN